MEIEAALVGASAGPRAHEIDARWLMAYAAALGETAAGYYETGGPAGPLVHPLFPVCYEWPLALDLRAARLSPEVGVRGVHATHDLRVHRPPRAGDCLRTTATVTAVEPRAPGAYVLTRFETVDADGRPVTTTDYGTLYLGVGTDGSRRSAAASPPEPPPGGTPGGAWSTAVAVPATLAHVYSECARIWNPIHTDRAVALAAGLPDIVLHGTATLALAVSALLAREPAEAAARVTRVVCRFGAMVRMPSTLSVRGWPAAEGAGRREVPFEVLTGEGRPAIRDGLLVTATPPR